MVEVPVDQVAIVGGSGKQLDVCRDGSREVIVVVNVSDGFGRPVRVKDVVVGWMRDHEAPTKKVSGSFYVKSCFVI